MSNNGSLCYGTPIYPPETPASPEPAPGLKLNLGAGSSVVPGYTNLDIKTGTDVRKLPFPDNSVEEVYASHVLEHLWPKDVIPALKEWVRVLKPHGTLRVAVPDFEWIVANRGQHNSRVMDSYLFGGHDDEHDVHHLNFDADKLSRAMMAAGCGHIRPFESFAADCSALPVSLNLEGTKRWWAPVADEPSFCIITSEPRIAFTNQTKCLVQLAMRMKFNVSFSHSAFWDKGMTCAIKRAMKFTDAKFYLFIDYDGTYTPEDVQKLFGAINSDPTLAAIGSVQMQRGSGKPLLFQPSVDYSKPVSDVGFSHFGLTIVRAEVFKELPQPWFWMMPGVDQDGNADWDTWNESDSDITFWRVMQEYGFRVAQHNEVVIGHLGLGNLWPKNSGSGRQFQPIECYEAGGKPPGAIFDPDLYRKLAEKPAEKPRDPQPDNRDQGQGGPAPVQQHLRERALERPVAD